MKLDGMDFVCYWLRFVLHKYKRRRRVGRGVGSCSLPRFCELIIGNLDSFSDCSPDLFDLLDRNFTAP